jgi:hypothetical protein
MKYISTLMMIPMHTDSRYSDDRINYCQNNIYCYISGIWFWLPPNHIAMLLRNYFQVLHKELLIKKAGWPGAN